MRGVVETENSLNTANPPDVYPFLPKRKQVSNFIGRFVDKYEQEFYEFIQENIRKNGCSFQLDMATSVTGHYFGITVTFFDSEWYGIFLYNNKIFRNLLSFTLNIMEYNDDTDGTTLRNRLDEFMTSKGFTDRDLLDNYYVVDEGANVNAALSQRNKINCACHVAETIGERSITPYSPRYRSADITQLHPQHRAILVDIESTLNAESSIVTAVRYVILSLAISLLKRNSNWKYQLEVALIKRSNTRWLTTHASVDRFISLGPDQLDFLNGKLSDAGKRHLTKVN